MKLVLSGSHFYRLLNDDQVKLNEIRAGPQKVWSYAVFPATPTLILPTSYKRGLQRVQGKNTWSNGFQNLLLENKLTLWFHFSREFFERASHPQQDHVGHRNSLGLASTPCLCGVHRTSSPQASSTKQPFTDLLISHVNTYPSLHVSPLDHSELHLNAELLENWWWRSP